MCNSKSRLVCAEGHKIPHPAGGLALEGFAVLGGRVMGGPHALQYAVATNTDNFCLVAVVGVLPPPLLMKLPLSLDH